MEVKMLKNTFYKGKRFLKGDIAIVDEEVAKRWRKNKIAATKKRDNKIPKPEPAIEETTEEIIEEVDEEVEEVVEEDVPASSE